MASFNRNDFSCFTVLFSTRRKILTISNGLITAEILGQYIRKYNEAKKLRLENVTITFSDGTKKFHEIYQTSINENPQNEEEKSEGQVPSVAEQKTDSKSDLAAEESSKDTPDSEQNEESESDALDVPIHAIYF